MSLHRITFYMIDGSRPSVEINDRQLEHFEAKLTVGGLENLTVEEQKGARLGERVTIGVMMAHVVSFEIKKL